MKDEIKEILEDVKRHLDYVEATKQASIRDNEMKVMYDYIINLQEETENKNNEIDVLKDQVEWWKQQCDDLEMQIGESNG